MTARIGRRAGTPRMPNSDNDRLRDAMCAFIREHDADEFLLVARNALRQVAEEDDDPAADAAGDMLTELIDGAG